MIVVLCNAPPDQAPRLARALVEEGLAACVNLLPGVRSIYRWQGEVHDEAETTLLVKTAASRAADLRARLAELHPYEVPEIVVLPVDEAASDPRYLAWVRSCTEGA